MRIIHSEDGRYTYEALLKVQAFSPYNMKRSGVPGLILHGKDGSFNDFHSATLIIHKHTHSVVSAFI